ncbi:hypothetical protein GEMRC1_003707 [Eukaryota sp. GEM-RC1]
MFLLLSFLSTNLLSNYPNLSSLLSRRGALVKSITSDIVRSSISGFESELHRIEAERSVLELSQLHNQILLAADVYGAHSSLLFQTNYNDDTTSLANVETNHGLHAAITGFVSLTNRYVSGVFSNQNVPDNSIIDEILTSSSTCYQLNLQSLEYLKSDFSEVVGSLTNWMLIVFLIFVVVISFIYFSVFRRMLSTLHEEESTTVEFLHMLGDDIISQVKVIREYVASLQ